MNPRPVRVFLVLFALMQGLLPLLHAHLDPVAASHEGVHFHAGSIQAYAPSATHALIIAAAPESPAITAPTEHRRHEHWLPTVWAAAPYRTRAAAAGNAGTWIATQAASGSALAPYTLPLPLAPPATC
jgi:hypothetical protein